MTILDPPDGPLVELPRQPAGVAWPTTAWPTGDPDPDIDTDLLERLLDRAVGSDADPDLAVTSAVVVVHQGRLVAERYGTDREGEPVDADSRLLSWSMAKSVTHALVGVLVGEGRLDPDAPAPVGEWADPDDPRHTITVDHLLRMVDGLDFCESYELAAEGADDVPFSHCIDMLFGAGADDVAAYAACRPAAHPPGTVFNYSSGTTNIVSRIVADTVGLRGEQFGTWMREVLFAPLGMGSAEPRFDAAGVFVGSSYLYATARDFARFGLLYLRGGTWDGKQIVPRHWVDAARTPRARDDTDGRLYGSHWWVWGDRRGTFWASGYEGQRIVCVPASDLVIVRCGITPAPEPGAPDALGDWLESLIAVFDPPGD